MRDQITDGALAAASLGNKTTVAGSGLAGLGWLASSEFAAVCGVVVAVVGLVVNVHYRRKADKRDDEMHKLRMAHERAQIAHAESELRRSLNYPNPNTGD